MNFERFKKPIVIAYDLISLLCAWYIGYLLRFNFSIPQEHFLVMLNCAPYLILFEITALFGLGLYRGTWRFSGMIELQKIVIALSLVGILFGIIVLTYSLDFIIPRSIVVLNLILAISFIGGGRLLYRLIRERQLFFLGSLSGEAIIVIGAGRTAANLIKEFKYSKEWRVVGALDSNPSMKNREIAGVKVLGSLSMLPTLSSSLEYQHIVIASTSLTNADRKIILDTALIQKKKVLTAPSLDDIISGRMTISQIRPVKVEDLLGREPVEIDSSGLQELIKGKSIVVSGAAGSIGSELCRQILQFNPSCLVCIDHSEYALYGLQQELDSTPAQSNITYVVADVKNVNLADNVLSKFKPSVVFHAAAYKHVPLMENINVAQCIYNNVIGTHTIAKAAIKARVPKFILISTDKAVNPTNVMGATKRMSEMVCQSLQKKTGTSFVSVRFGNVLGSSGSVIPKFREQIANGGPVTVTHKLMTRYFMSIPEATQLVLQSCLLGRRGEIFVLDMGVPVKILDLARNMIKLSGFSEKEIKITFSGTRPGEKLYEELLMDHEKVLPTLHNKIFIANAKKVSGLWVGNLLKWIGTINEKDEHTIKREIKNWVEDYQPKDMALKKTKSVKV